MKKLLYIGGFDLPDGNAACHRAISNSKLFKMIGINSSLLGVSKSSNLEKGVVHQLGSKDGINMMVVNYPQRAIDWLNFIIGDSATLMHIKKNKPDMIIMYNYPAIASLRIHWLCKKSGIESISDITEWYSSYNKNLIRRMIKWFDTTLRINFVARLSKRVITTSQYMTNFYESKGLKCLELPTLFDVSELIYNTHRPKETSELECIKLVYFGSPFDKSVAIHDNRQVKERLDKVISAVYNNHLKHNINLNIYGVTKSDFLDVYPDYSVVLETLNKCVFFHGRVAHDELVSFISMADYSIFFRDDTRVNKAGFPSKLAESITLGIPVITSDISALKKYKDIAGVNLCSIGYESQELDKILCKRLRNNSLPDRKYFDYRSYKVQAEGFFCFNGNEV
ncbi:group 1 glycosyl transferase [Vibrio cholerae]|nr:putative glycosyltransferase [Vibrio cholerae]BCN21380.1 putative glycosyltransferase [Vibrio cholerae]GHX12385.1 group 1 glycosyl transferase [Vibrio cholerae]GHY77445.1 group 1 glycosyl transferase [Vibrio cholerae]